MTTTRAAVGRLAVSAALGASTLGLPGTASAATARDTFPTTTLAVPSSLTIDYGETIDVALDVDADNGYSPTEGTSTLYARTATSSTWTAVMTNTSASLDFFAVRPRMTTTYKVAYSGHVAAATRDDSYEPSESATFTVEVARTMTRPEGGFEVSGRVRPRYGSRPIVVRVSEQERGGFTRFTTIRTDARGRYALTLPRRSGVWYWSFAVKADRAYLGTRFKWRTWVSPERAG